MALEQVEYLCVHCVFAIVVPGFELELLNSGVELLKVLWLYFALEICARSEVLKP